MEPQDDSAPEVRIIIPPKSSTDSKKKRSYAKKKGTSKKVQAYIATGAVITILVLALIIAYFFPDWDPIPKGEDENIVPEPSIDILNIERASSDFIVVDINATIVFSAINSTDKDGTINKYMWDFGDGYQEEGIKVQHIYSEPDTYTVTLEITDDKGSSASANMIVRVNAPPVARFDTAVNTVPVNTPVYFSGAQSYDPDWTKSGSGIQRYSWNFDDGSPLGSGMNITHVFSDAGNFSVTLTVWDWDEKQNTVLKDISIILRTYNVEWKENNDSALDRWGFTTEGNTTRLTTNITVHDISRVVIKLNWTDFIPPPINISDDDPDEFKLTVTSPSGEQKSLNSTSELIVITFRDITKRSDYTIDAESQTDAAEIVNSRSPPSDAETGQWQIDITAVDCPGSIFQDDGFFSDRGNLWHISVNYFYYTVKINEQ